MSTKSNKTAKVKAFKAAQQQQQSPAQAQTQSSTVTMKLSTTELDVESAASTVDALTAKIAQLESPQADSTSTSTSSSNGAESVSQLLSATKINNTKDMKQWVVSLINSSDSNDEKIKQFTSRYSQLLQDNLSLITDREKVAMQLNKTNNLKMKMELLCRELQKQNKSVMDESKRVADEEQLKRQELAKRFQDAMNQVSAKMEEQGEERIKLFKENEMLKDKLRSFAEQYQIREKHFEMEAKAKDLELQLLEAKLKQQTEIASQESHRAKTYNDQINTLTMREKELNTQLAYYAEKFEQFQETLTKSNEIFTTFKQEMEKMSKTIKKSEKENGELRKKCEQTDVALIDLAEEKQLESVTSQKKKLEDLCRVLQTERAQLKQQLDQQRSESNKENTTSDTAVLSDQPSDRESH